MKKAFYFAYGKDSFGVQKELGSDLTVDFNSVEGAGIALIKSVNIEDFKDTVILKITNNFKKNVNLRIEKKYDNNIITEKLTLKSKSSKTKVLNLSNDDKNKLKEIVVAVLKEDNSPVIVSISVDATIK